jgi:hypothetical protein
MSNAIDLYIEQLEQTFTRLGKKGFAASYPIISINGQRKYHLIFVCSHFKAATLASNVVNSIEETYQHEKEEYKEHLTGQMSFFTSEINEKQIFEEKVKKLRDALLNLPKNKPTYREELHYELMIRDRSWFGKIGRKHLTQSLKELLNEPTPRIKCVGTPGNDDSVITILEQKC